jgi:NADPH-dependent ferric siderophore reductase
MRRITLTSPEFVGVDVNPAQDAELVLVEESGRRVKRRYTIRSARPESGEWDLDVLLHGHGPGSSWGATASNGDEITLFGPRGRLALTDVAWQLFVGDEASLPAFAALAEVTPPSVAIYALVEVESDADHIPLVAAPDVALTTRWINRGDHEPGTADLLAPELELFVRTRPAGAGHAYLLGESRSVVALRQPLAEILPSEQIFTKGYWNRVGPRR